MFSIFHFFLNWNYILSSYVIHGNSFYEQKRNGNEMRWQQFEVPSKKRICHLNFMTPSTWGISIAFSHTPWPSDRRLCHIYTSDFSIGDLVFECMACLLCMVITATRFTVCWFALSNADRVSVPVCAFDSRVTKTLHTVFFISSI